MACRLLTINFASSALETLEKAIRIFETAASEHVPPNGLVRTSFRPRLTSGVLMPTHRTFCIDYAIKRTLPSMRTARS